MPGASEPEHPVLEEQERGSPSGSNRSLLSVVGLSIVSLLNVGCLAFIGYYVASHPEDPHSEGQNNAAIQPSMTDVGIVAAPPLAVHLNAGMSDHTLGNIDFAPTSRFILSIASGIDMANGEALDVGPSRSVFVTEPTRKVETAAGHATELSASEYWVQIGALSKKATADQYWSNLKKQHSTLLKNRNPRYFGPKEVGGSLIHVRLGPMAGDAAKVLCSNLKDKGVDCFCVRPAQKDIS